MKNILMDNEMLVSDLYAWINQECVDSHECGNAALAGVMADFAAALREAYQLRQVFESERNPLTTQH